MNRNIFLATIALMIAAIASSVIATSIGADLFVKQWYPKGGNYVFVCEAQGFTPTAYDWDFGDGQKLYDVTNKEVFHHYEKNGQYHVSCTPSDGEYHWAIATLPVDVTTAEARVDVKQWYPKGLEYVFICNTDGLGFTPTAYDWDFGDGQKLYDVTNRDVFHRYDNGGQYVVSCTASDGWGNDVIGWKAINAESSEV